MHIGPAPDPKPMPEIRPARIYLRDAAEALHRLDRAWNETQFIDGLRSLEYYVAKMRNVIDSRKEQAHG